MKREERKSETQKSKFTNLSIVILILVVAFVIRAYVAAMAPLDDDEAWYLMDAYNVLRGLVPFRDFHTRSPLYLYILAALSYLTGNSIYAARMVSVISTVISGGMIYTIAIRFVKPRYALVPMSLYLLNPVTVRYGTTVMTEPFAVFLGLLGLYMGIRGMEFLELSEGQGIMAAYMAVSGLILLLAFLVRRSAAVVFVGMIGAITLYTHYRGIDPKRYLGALTPAVLVFILPFFVLFYLMSSWRGLDYASYMYLTEAMPIIGYSGTYMQWYLFYITAVMYIPLLLGLLPLLWSFSRVRKAGLICVALGSVVPTYLLIVFTGSPITTIPALKHELVLWGMPYGRAFVTLAAALLSLGVAIGLVPKLRSQGRSMYSIIALALVISTQGLGLTFPLGILNLTDQRLVPMIYLFLIALSTSMAVAYIQNLYKIYDEASIPMLRIIAHSILILGVILCVGVIKSNPAVIKLLWIFGILFIPSMIVSYFVLWPPKALSQSLNPWGFLTHSLRPINLIAASALTLALPLLFNALYVPFLLVSVPLSALIIALRYRGDGTWDTHPAKGIVFTTLLLIILGAMAMLLYISHQDAAFAILYGIGAMIPIGLMFHLSHTPLTPTIPLPKNAGGWCLSLLPFLFVSFYLLRPWVMPPYMADIMPYLCLSTALLLPSFSLEHKVEVNRVGGNQEPRFGGNGKEVPPSFPSNTTYALMALAVLITFTSLLSTGFYGLEEYYVVEDHNELHPPLQQIRDVADYIKAHTKPGEEIFAWPIYAYASQRPMVANISRPFALTSDSVSISDYPTAEGLINHMEEAGLRVVVLDFYMSSFLLPYNPALDSYIKHHYTPVRRFGDATIYLRIESFAS